MVGARPVLNFEPEPAEPVDDAVPWYRRPLSVVAAALLVIFAAGAGTFVALRNDSSAAAPAAPAPSITTTAPEAAPRRGGSAAGPGRSCRNAGGAGAPTHRRAGTRRHRR